MSILLPALGVGVLAIAAMAKGGGKTTEDNGADDFNYDQMSDSPSVDTPPVIPTPKPKPEWRGKYDLSVQTGSVGRFNAASHINKIITAIKSGNLLQIQSLTTGLTTNQVRALHNAYVDRTGGKSTLYIFIRTAPIPGPIKQLGYDTLNASGVGQNLKKLL